MNLKDKVVVVTGGTGGIGLATVKKFIAEGSKVVIADINEEVGQKVITELKETGADVKFVQTNVTKYEEVVALVEKTVEVYGRIDVMFNNAGIVKASPLLTHNPSSDYDPIIAVNQNGVYYGILAAAKKMVELGIKGTIINTASVFGYLPGEFTFSYNATKAAVKLMTSSAAMELGSHGIRVVAIAPGRVNTPILNEYKEMGVWDQVKSEQMRREFTEPEEIANAVAFLASEEANCINGTCVKLDDGYSEFKMPLLLK
ncbi:SDR family NAD(P)-dependent oxidoreductase [Lysinibacillus sphaericus]|uniref:SDR family NAD(P)-dependent oxidoreductase n=1 Tax=Lysinibacillus sphaericus TaxID=1421 RepID=UPI00248CF95D|nr:SDR family oxidoreductase [Lysinibacillus sphaericus]